MEMGGSLHQCQEVDALNSRGTLDRGDEGMEDRAELGTLGLRHFTEIQ
jgi:hypothetical protein